MRPREGDVVTIAPTRIAVVLYPGVEPMDYQGPCAVFDLWHADASGPEVIVVAETLAPVACAYGRPLLPQYSFANCPPFDALLVPGGRGRKQHAPDSEFMTFLRRRGAECAHLLSVCTGVFLLQAAKLVQVQRVTTHWEFIDELCESGALQVCGEQRFVQDGHLWTAAGVFSGIDMALAFIDSFHGTPRPDGSIRMGEAGRVQLSGQYFPSEQRYSL